MDPIINTKYSSIKWRKVHNIPWDIKFNLIWRVQFHPDSKFWKFVKIWFQHLFYVSRVENTSAFKILPRPTFS